jgi:hypothetical protein
MDEHATALNDNAAALDYACHMVREVRTNGGYDDPRLVVTVKNEMRRAGKPPTGRCAPSSTTYAPPE